MALSGGDPGTPTVTRKALLTTAGTGCVVSLIFLGFSALRGRDLGAPTGLLVGCLLFGVVGFFASPVLAPADDWLWRHGAGTGDKFPVAREPGAVVTAVREISGRRRGWSASTDQSSDAVVRIRVGATPAAWAKLIEVSVQPADGGSLVSVKSSSPQLFDWGANRRVVASLRRELETGK